MSLEFITQFLLGCSLLNYLILLCWFLLFTFAHEGLYALHTRWFQLSRDRFDALHYLTMAVYKIGVLLFNIVPYLVLRILL